MKAEVVRKMRVDFGNFRVPAMTVVSNEFIDHYMPTANGEYVKVYLYLLRHAGEEISQGQIAGALDLTEGDVGRALARWQREGLLAVRGEEPSSGSAVSSAGLRRTRPEGAAEVPDAEQHALSGEEETDFVSGRIADGITKSSSGNSESKYKSAIWEEKISEGRQPEPENPGSEESAAEAEKQRPEAEKQRPEALPSVPEKAGVDFLRLKSDEEFTTLLYVVQRYLSRIFSQTDTETVAYLYDRLHMSAELIEYLAELCAQRGKTSMRYFESIALDWYRNGIHTVEDAKERGTRLNAESYAVMKAFGLKGRNPGTEEEKLIGKWFREYGFSKELVLEACGRTLLRAGQPSFPYADRILTDWHAAGVRTRADVLRLDEAAGKTKRERKAGEGSVSRAGQRTGTRFHNLSERQEDDSSLDEIGLRLMQKRLLKKG